MRKFNVLMIMLLVLLTGCGNDEEFVIDCNIRGLGSEGVEMTYINRGVQRAVFHPVDGKVTLRGSSAEPVLVEVSTSDGRPLFTCIAANGDELDVKMDTDTPGKIEIKGNDASRDYSRFISANDSLLRSGDVAAVNRLVAEEVRSHPDRISSAAILVTCFNARGYELEADSLVNVLKADARPSGVVGAFPGKVGEQVSADARGPVKAITVYCGHQNDRDTVIRYWPSSQSYTLIAVTGRNKGDSVRKVLRTLTDSLHQRRFKALELCVMADSVAWELSIRRDSAKWMQGWLPGSVANPAIRNLQIPSVPFFIVANSMGRQVYRGHSLSAADDSIRHRLSRFLKKNDSKKEDETDAKATGTDSREKDDKKVTTAPASAPAKTTQKRLPSRQLAKPKDAEIMKSADSR